MADEERPDEEQPDQAAVRRRRAQDAAGDLERMGIDPRSLGLGEMPAREPAPDLPERGGSVVQLRPDQPQSAAPVTQPEAAPSSESPHQPTPSQNLLARPALPPARETSRFFRLVARGLTTPDAAVAAQDERAVVESARHRQTDRRIVAFVAGKGGVGCTTLAVGVGTTFMALREDRSVVVDVQAGAPTLTELYGAASPMSITALPNDGQPVVPPTVPTGLAMVSGGTWDETVTRGDVAGVLDRLGTDHTFNLLDVGDDAGEGGHAALARADQAVVISGPGHAGDAALAEALQRVRTVNPSLVARVVRVIVCPHEESFRETSRANPAGSGVVVVPPDPYLLGGNVYDAHSVSAATRQAVLRVAAAVALGSVHG
jgi:MinD-like ATPase involved in chromosome partitioning or flagellar assembly